MTKEMTIRGVFGDCHFGQCATVFNHYYDFLLPAGTGKYYPLYHSGRGIPQICHTGRRV